MLVSTTGSRCPGAQHIRGNLPLRTAATYTLGHAYQLQGDRAAARQAYTDTITISSSFRHSIYTLAATLGLGQLQEADNQLSLAAESYRRVLHLGDLQK